MTDMPEKIYAFKIEGGSGEYLEAPGSFGRTTQYTRTDLYEAALAERDALTDWCDLMVDEFKRIKSCQAADDEIKQLCDRAVSNTIQRVPVIAQRDNAVEDVRMSIANDGEIIIEGDGWLFGVDKDGDIAYTIKKSKTSTKWIAGKSNLGNALDLYKAMERSIED